MESVHALLQALSYEECSINLPRLVQSSSTFIFFPSTNMEGYAVLEKLGSGSFGNVWKASKKTTGETVAIKELKSKFKNLSSEACLDLMEVKCLRKLKHPNIVKLKEVIREYDSLFLIFECMEGSLRDLLRKRQGFFTEDEVRDFCFQIFRGLAYMHECGFFHRDLKPDNLLVSGDTVKIADLGSAREINSMSPPTEYITTRWYRAPEVLLQSTYRGEAKYNSAIDMWAMGTIMAEFYRLFPLFPGKNGADQIYQICRVLGSPTEIEWPRGHELARSFLYEFPNIDSAKALHLYTMIPSASSDAFNLIKSLLTWDPCKRPTAFEALQHPFFQSCYPIPVPVPVGRSSVKQEAKESVPITKSSVKRKVERSDTTDIYGRYKKRAKRTAVKEKIVPSPAPLPRR